MYICNIIHFYPPSFPSNPFYIWNPLQNVCLPLYPLLLHIYVNKSIYKCNSLTSFSIVCIYMLLWLSTWYWINYQEEYYWGKWMLPFSAIVIYTQFFIHKGVLIRLPSSLLGCKLLLELLKLEVLTGSILWKFSSGDRYCCNFLFTTVM